MGMMELRASGRRRAVDPWQVVLTVGLVAISITTVVPFLFMASTSLTQSFSMMSYPPVLIPKNPSLDNFVTVITQFQDGLFSRWFVNSVLITAAIVIGSLCLNTLSGYLFAKKDFIGREVTFFLILSTIFVPPAVTLIPAFRVVVALHLYDTYGALVVPALASPIGIFLMRQFISTLPNELIEAGKIDGANEVQVFVHLIVPLSKPGIAALGIFTTVSAWNNFLWPLVVLRTATMYTLPVGIASLAGQFQVDYGLVMAASVLTVLPMLALYVLFQSYFVEGVRLGAVK
jgi:multiple sugar transport system permease protein